MTGNTTFDALINELLEGDADACRQATDKLVQGGKPAIEALLRAIQEDDRNESLVSCEHRCMRETLTKMGNSAFNVLIEALLEQSGILRGRAAIKTLVLFNDTRVVEPFVKVMLDKRYGQNPRCYAMDALAYFKDPRAFDALILALEDEDVLIVGHAARALGEYRDKRALEPLRKALNNSSETPWMDWREAVRNAIRAIEHPDYRPFDRGFFITNHYYHGSNLFGRP